MLKRFALAAAVSAALATGSLAQQQPRQQQPGQQQQQRQQTDMTQEQQKEQAKQFLQAAWSNNRLETELGQRVVQLTQDRQVRQFAERMAREHEQANVKLRNAAQQANIQIQQEMNPVDQAILQQFQQYRGERLDRDYLFHQVAAHHKAMLHNQYMAQNADDQTIRQYAQEMVSSLQQHSRQAQQLAQTQAGIDVPRLMGQIRPGEQGQQQWRDQKQQPPRQQRDR